MCRRYQRQFLRRMLHKNNAGSASRTGNMRSVSVLIKKISTRVVGINTTRGAPGGTAFAAGFTFLIIVADDRIELVPIKTAHARVWGVVTDLFKTRELDHGLAELVS